MSVDSGSSGFRLPGSSLEEVFKVIQGYASFGKKASLGDISKNTGMNNTVISRNVGFLLSLGLLEGGRDKNVTETGSKLGLALMHDVPDEIEAILSNVVGDDEFLKSVIAAVRIRKGMDESALRSHIAYSAGQSKTGATSTGTGAVVELLKRSGYLRAEDGKLVVSNPTKTNTHETISRDTANGSIQTVSKVRSLSHTVSTDAPFAISIKIEVNCEPNDLDDLGKKLRKVIDDFSNQQVDSDDEE